MTLDLTHGLLKDLKKLHESDEDCNVILKIGRGFDINSFNAHSVILKARSQFFKDALKDLKRNNKLFRKENFITLEVPNISADAFKVILKYIYMGTISLNEIANQESVLFMLDLMISADELQLYELVDYLQNYIVENFTDWVFMLLRRRLSNLILHIRFFTISAAQYYEEIRPFAMVLPEQLKEDLERYYIVPNSLPPTYALPPRILPKRSSKVFIDQLAAEPKELAPDDCNGSDDSATSKMPKKFPTPDDVTIPLRISTSIYARTESPSSGDSLLSPSPDIDFDSILINRNQIKRISRWIDGIHNVVIRGNRNNINREGIDDIILSRIKNANVAIFDGDSNYDIGFSDLQLFSGIYEHVNYEKKLMIEKNFSITNYEVYQVKMT
ncbi:9515_t:CDS:2 [Funneliformis caledonium]|uniref:9515_t:CDS:1 n=1 Tax=Funneliformis caledonium TaxID=1117310 RepID=A0A9N9AE20_9GLOM|nr:9515_t:CDS:2 [Funneliformis caledonium]